METGTSDLHVLFQLIVIKTLTLMICDLTKIIQLESVTAKCERQNFWF